MLAKKMLSKIEQENNPLAAPPVAAPQKHKPCNCSKSKCLKLYCECFANNRYCTSECSCNCCSNLETHECERLQAKESILMRNPLAFRSKIETSLDEESLFKKDINVGELNYKQNSDVLLSTSTKAAAFGILAV